MPEGTIDADLLIGEPGLIGNGVGGRVLEILREILATEAAPNCSSSPLQPPSPEHMMAQSGSPLQWLADQLWPSSWAVSATRRGKLLVNSDCDRP